MKTTIVPTTFMILLLAGCSATRDAVKKEPAREGAVPPSAAERAAVEAVEQKIAAGDASGALGTYEEAFGKSPVGQADTILYAALLREAGSPEEARAVLEALLAVDSRSAEALYGLALLEQAAGSQDLYRSLLEEAIDADPGHAGASAALGELVRREGNLEEAEALFGRALDSDPESIVALTGLGRLNFDRKEFEKAEEYYGRIINTAPEFAFAYFDRAKVRRRRSDYEGATADLDRALQLDPDYYWGYVDRGRLHMLLGRLEAAADDFDRAGALDPDGFVAFVYAGGARYQLQQWEPARIAFERVTELNPDYTFVYAPLGEIYYRRQAWEDAAASFIRGFDRAPRETHLPLVAALAMKWSGEEKLAREFLRNNLSKMPAEGWIRSTADFLIRPDYDLPMISAIRSESNPIAKKRMLFYLGVQYLIIGRRQAGVVYLLEATQLERDELLEKRLADWELERQGIDE